VEKLVHVLGLFGHRKKTRGKGFKYLTEERNVSCLLARTEAQTEPGTKLVDEELKGLLVFTAGCSGLVFHN